MSETIQVRIPQIGEGLRSAKIVRILVSPGEWVEEDSDVIEVETEKATIAIPSPCAGYVASISCEPGEVIEVGVVVLEVSRIGAPSQAPALEGESFKQVRKGALARNVSPLHVLQDCAESLPESQISLMRHMRDSREIVIPASLERRIIWDDIDRLKKACRRADGGANHVPTSLSIFCWAIAQGMQSFSKFRWKVTRDNKVEIFEDSLLGIATTGEDDTLENCGISVNQGDSLGHVHDKVRSALSRAPTYVQYHSVTISDMSAFQTVRGQPVVVYPAIATLLIGTPYSGILGPGKYVRFANLVLAFDHRVINGVYAARFLKQIEKNIRTLAIDFERQCETFKQEVGSGEVIQKYGT